MTSTNGSEPVQPSPAPRTRTPRPASTSTDPEVLAAEIERTREDLAETLDAIADRVSPKRVADRTRKQVAEVVADLTTQVKGRAEQVRGKVVEQAGHAKDAAVSAKDAATGAGARTGSLSSSGDTTGGVPALPPVTAVQAAGLDLRTAPVSADTVAQPTSPASLPTPASTPSLGGTSAVKPEVVAGGALGLLLLLLLRRRRRTRRAGGKGAVRAAKASRKAAKASAKASAKAAEARRKRRARR